MLSDALHAHSEVSERQMKILAGGCLSPSHAAQFCAFIKNIKNRYALSAIISGEQKFPADPEDRDSLYFLAQSFRAQLIKELPPEKDKMSAAAKGLAVRGKTLLMDLAAISLEIAQMTVTADDDDRALPDWFLVEVARDLPRLAVKNKK
jgi:hypothetical protein